MPEAEEADAAGYCKAKSDLNPCGEKIHIAARESDTDRSLAYLWLRDQYVTIDHVLHLPRPGLVHFTVPKFLGTARFALITPKLALSKSVEVSVLAPKGVSEPECSDDANPDFDRSCIDVASSVFHREGRYAVQRTPLAPQNVQTSSVTVGGYHHYGHIFNMGHTEGFKISQWLASPPESEHNN